MAIRLQFSTSLEASSALIRRLCHSKFSHVDILLPDGTCLGASNSPHAPYIEGNPNGVAIRPVNYQEFGIRRIATLVSTPEVEKLFYEIAMTQLGKPFDDAALQAFLSADVEGNRDWREEGMWFCSEYATWSLEQAKFFPYELVSAKNRVSPADLSIYLNPYMDVAAFQQPIPGLTLGKHEV